MFYRQNNKKESVDHYFMSDPSLKQKVCYFRDVTCY